MLVPTIGIEVHVELKSYSKVFSNSKNNFKDEPNTNVNEIDLGYPGTLPKLNKEIINMALKAALVLNCSINKVMHFDRKNYFYPDLPKGYQITQYDTPIGHDGYLEIEVEGLNRKIGIERVHIEEDTCKSIHTKKGTLLNANRAGIPLIEIVSKPDITSSLEAIAYIEKLKEILLYLGISDVKIEEGSMRCDANISLKEEASFILGTKTEIKNIGSITNVGTSINYEIIRQKEIIRNNQKIIEETRRFDDKTGTTISMRVKETGNDYRYFPEPDLPYVEISDNWIEEIKAKMPLLPAALKHKYQLLGFSEVVIKTLLSNKLLDDFFESLPFVKIINVDMLEDIIPRLETYKDIKAKIVMASNLLSGDVISYLNKNYFTMDDIMLNQTNFTDLIDSIYSNKISNKQGKEVLNVLLSKGGDVNTIIKDLGMVQISDEKLLLEIVTKVINDNSSSVTDFKQGKDRAVKYLMGQIMALSKGQANPQNVNKMLLEELGKI